MKQIFAAAVSLALLGTPAVHAQGIQITPNGSTPTSQGPEANFTGQVFVDSVTPAIDNPPTASGIVSFPPGGRTAWHSHPAGQMLVILSGQGWVQEESQPRKEMKPGDLVWIPAGIKHWHGATATNAMRHLAVSFNRDGKNTDWFEKVTDGPYRVN